MSCVGDGADACSWVDDDDDTADEANEEEKDVDDDDDEDDDIIREVSRENTVKHLEGDPLQGTMEAPKVPPEQRDMKAESTWRDDPLAPLEANEPAMDAMDIDYVCQYQRPPR